MVADVLVDDQGVAVVGNDRRHNRPAEADALAVELIGAQRYFRIGIRLERGERAFRRRYAVLAAAYQLGNGQVLHQTVLQRRWRRAHGRLFGHAHRSVVGQPGGEVQKATIAVQRVV